MRKVIWRGRMWAIPYSGIGEPKVPTLYDGIWRLIPGDYAANRDEAFREAVAFDRRIQPEIRRVMVTVTELKRRKRTKR